MRVSDQSTHRRTEFSVQVNWSRARTFSVRQRFWIRDKVPDVAGTYVIYLRDGTYSYGRRKQSPIVYFGSGWINQRLFHHLDKQENPILAKFLDHQETLLVRWAAIEDEDNEDWPVVTESLFILEFTRLFGELPPANRIQPPQRRMRDSSVFQQHPIDVFEDL